MKTKCKFCDRPSVGRGLCMGHYQRWRRTGEESDAPLRERSSRNVECSIDGCTEMVGLGARGLCALHYARSRTGYDMHAPKMGAR